MCLFSLYDCNHTRNKAKSILPSPREQSASSKAPPCLCLHTLESYIWYYLLTFIHMFNLTCHACFSCELSTCLFGCMRQGRLNIVLKKQCVFAQCAWTHPIWRRDKSHTQDNSKFFDHPPPSSLQVSAQSGHQLRRCSLRNTKNIECLMLWLNVGPQFCSTAKCVATQVRTGNTEIHVATLHVFCHIFSQFLAVIAHIAPIKCLPCRILLHPDFCIHKLFNIYGRKENNEIPIFIMLNPR